MTYLLPIMLHQNSTVQQPILLTATLRGKAGNPANRNVETYLITPDDLGPVDTVCYIGNYGLYESPLTNECLLVWMCTQRYQTTEEVNEFFGVLDSMSFYFQLWDKFAADSLELCYVWDVHIALNAGDKVMMYLSLPSSSYPDITLVINEPIVYFISLYFYCLTSG